MCTQRLGSGDPSVFTTHSEYHGLHGAEEMTLTLKCRAKKQGLVDYLVTGRIDSSGRDFYVCHRKTDPVALIETMFQLGFSRFG